MNNVIDFDAIRQAKLDAHNDPWGLKREEQKRINQRMDEATDTIYQDIVNAQTERVQQQVLCKHPKTFDDDLHRTTHCGMCGATLPYEKNILGEYAKAQDDALKIATETKVTWGRYAIAAIWTIGSVITIFEALMRMK